MEVSSDAASVINSAFRLGSPVTAILRQLAFAALTDVMRQTLRRTTQKAAEYSRDESIKEFPYTCLLFVEQLVRSRES